MRYVARLYIVTAIREGVDVSALYRTYRLAMVRLAVLLVDDTASAEDVVQDAFAALYRNQGGIREPEAAMAYVRKSVVNGCRSALRRRQTVRLHVLVAPPDEPAADAGLLLAEDQRAVLTAVHQLAPRQQEVLVLRYWSNLSEAEIAATLGISRGAVKSTASKAVDRVEQILGGAR
jgi:RNA polymerase sigma-70 factor (sigma-E family)